MSNTQHAQFSDENGNIYYLENATEDVKDESGNPISDGGDLSEASVKFTADTTRKLPQSGGRLKAHMGSIVKFLSDLKAICFSGSYSDLSNKPSIPSGAAASQAVANNCTTTAAGSVLDARQGKVLMDKANQLSSDITPNSIGNAIFAENWSGVVSNVQVGEVRFIFGTISHNSDTPPEWGELVCTLPDYYNKYCKYWTPVSAFQTSGYTIDAFVISTTGEVRVYSPDYEQIKRSEYHITAISPAFIYIPSETVGS